MKASGRWLQRIWLALSQSRWKIQGMIALLALKNKISCPPWTLLVNRKRMIFLSQVTLRSLTKSQKWMRRCHRVIGESASLSLKMMIMKYKLTLLIIRLTAMIRKLSLLTLKLSQYLGTCSTQYTTINHQIRRKLKISTVI